MTYYVVHKKCVQINNKQIITRWGVSFHCDVHCTC